MIGSFNKKCANCGKKIKKGYEFCPFCGDSLNFKSSKKNRREDYGLLGKNDVLEEGGFMLPRGLNSMLGGLINELNKQITELDRELKPDDKTKKKKAVSGFSISIESNGNSPIKIKTFGNNINGLNLTPKPQVRAVRQIRLPKISSDKLLSLKKLPRKEPETSVRRLSDKIIYEINLPGVKSLNEISINVIQNMVEIKAISDKKVYIKDLSINHPLESYDFREGKLILDFSYD